MRQETSPAPESVQFSRTLGILSATALGGSVVLGAGIFVSGSQFAHLSGSDAPLVFFISALLFLPLILSSIQRSSSALANAGFYEAARHSGSAARLFFAGWLMLGGYLMLGSLLACGAAMRMTFGLERVFGFKIGNEIVTFLLVLAAFGKEVLAKRESWRTRTVIFWTSLAYVLVLVIWGTFAHFRTGIKIVAKEPLQHWLMTVSMLASGLWAIDMVLNYRGQYRRPNRTAFWSLAIMYCGTNLLGALTALEVLRNPSLLMENWMTALSWNEHRLELLILIAGFLICTAGLMRVMTRITRLFGAMILDGALPSSKTNQEEGAKIHYYYSALFSALVAYCAITIPIEYLLLITGFGALLSLVFYIQPLLKKGMAKVTPFSLPLHPLIPTSAIVLSIFLMWILPISDLYVGTLWLLGGAAVYWFYTRKRMLPLMQQAQVLTSEGVKPSSPIYRVLVCVDDEEINESLIRIGSSAAAAKNGELLVLRILETSELLPANLQRSRGESEWTRIHDALQKMGLTGPAVVPVVRMAPDPISGIRATLREYDVDLLLVDWPKETVERFRKKQLQGLLQLTAKPLGILKGQVGEKLHSVSVACGNSAHSIEALQIGEAIASASESGMEALRIVRRSETEDVAKAAIQTVIEQSGIRLPTEIVLSEESDIETGILKHSEGKELLLIGASDDPLTGRPLPDGPSIEVALERKQATLIVKGKEEASRFLMRRVMAEMTNRVTAMTPKERSELLGNLKVGLQARADFYLMVALAASIAITGLIMNDGSIVLGAMLVSPLMSPIVGIACGIALGNLDLMRRSGASTFKGMALVLGMGVAMTFFLPRVEPTDQILSRTHPGIFDLLAALAAGAAGAYSLGKKTVAGALPGVAMSLSLEPPLATAGYGLSTSQFWITGGALLLFMTNLAAIVLSGVAVYLLLGMRPPRREGLHVVIKAVLSVVLTTFILIVPLGLGTYGSLQKGHVKYQIESQFRSEALRERFQLLDLKITEQEDGFLIHPTVLASEEVTPEKLDNFRKLIERKVGTPIQIEATILQTKQMDSPPSNDKK